MRSRWKPAAWCCTNRPANCSPTPTSNASSWAVATCPPPSHPPESQGACMPITGTTRVFYILGDPVAQVRAPEVYNHIFQQHGIDAVVVPLKAAARDLRGFLQHGMRPENIGGFWVPIPHKPAIAQMLNPTDPVAR